VIATFSLAQPLPLAIGLAVLAGAAVALHVRRPILSFAPQPDAGEPALPPEPPASPRPALAVLVGLATAVFAVLIGAFQTPVAHALLLICAVWLAFSVGRSFYARVADRVDEQSARTLRLCRGTAVAALLVLAGRPGCTWNAVSWERPLLVVLLDQSRSMSVTDLGSSATRAALAEKALRAAAQHNDLLEERFEIQFRGFGEALREVSAWSLRPADAATAIGAALRAAGQSRSSVGEPVAAVLLVSDGAETAAESELVRQAAAEIAQRKAALVCIGVGPAAGRSPAIELDPLSLPSRIGVRERVRVPITGSINAPSAASLQIGVSWDGGSTTDERVALPRGTTVLRHEVAVTPPSEGLHRLTIRATLPAEFGGAAAEQSALVEVRDERVKVLFVDGQLRSETAFAARALRTDPAFDVTQRILAKDSREPHPVWREYDVIVLGDVPDKALDAAALESLADAVRAGGVGLLIAGGQAVFGSSAVAKSELAAVAPVDLGKTQPVERTLTTLTQTEAGARHPALSAPRDTTTQPATIDSLPPLPVAVQLGRAKPLAQVLFATAGGDDVLVAHEAGRGRAAAASWDATWPWALASDEGFVRHRLLWRGLAKWLANRRPSAWVLTDRADYPLPQIVSGAQAVAIRAGITGVPDSAPDRVITPKLRVRRIDGAVSSAPAQPGAGIWSDLSVARQGKEWHAGLGGLGWPAARPAEGAYELEFSVTGSAADAPLVARAVFRVLGVDVELREPTANLALLRDCAARTAAHGGAYFDLSDADGAFRALTQTDRRRKIERPERFDFAGRMSWALLVVATAALCGEWLIRKQRGLR
jgi:hypothetical protein